MIYQNDCSWPPDTTQEFQRKLLGSVKSIAHRLNHASDRQGPCKFKFVYQQLRLLTPDFGHKFRMVNEWIAVSS